MANDLAGTHILVIDNASEVRSLRKSLNDEGFFKLSDMSDGLKVLTGIKKDKPEVVVCNQHIPRYSGVQIFKSISGDKELANIKFIMTTPKLSKRERDELVSQGIRNILERPFSDEALRDLIFSLFGIAVEDMESVAEEFYKDGMELFKGKDFEKALTTFKNANDAFECAEYFYMQGRCYIELEMWDQAIAGLKNTIRVERNYKDVDKYMGMALRAKEDMGGALESLERASKQPDATAETHVELGKTYLSTDQIPKADESFRKATDMDSGNVDIRIQIGNAYLDKGVFDKAEDTFGDAIGMSPDTIQLYNRMAIALRKQGKHREAINIYIKALKITCKDEALYFNLARALHEAGEKEKAIKSLNMAIKLDPEFTEAIELKIEYISDKKA